MKITQEMLNAAVKQAVKTGLIPKWADEENYMKNWNAIESILKAAWDQAESKAKAG